MTEHEIIEKQNVCIESGLRPVAHSEWLSDVVLEVTCEKI